MSRWRALCAVLAALSLRAADELPREVLLLARIKDHLRSELTQLPDHTGLVTLTRFHKAPERGARMRFLDTVRLEVLFSGSRELFASPGDRRFVQDNPAAFAGGGLTGTGLFALHLRSVVANAGTLFTYAGQDGRTVRYDFHLPASLSGHKISVVGGSGTAGMEGSIWVDAQSLDLLRLDTRAVEIPPGLPVEEATSTVEYATVRLSGREVHLPQSGELYLRETSGEENRNLVNFTHYRSYRAESSLLFGLEPVEPRAAPAPSPEPGRNVPALLLVVMQLETPIAAGDAVGALIQGKVCGTVRHKGRVIIPDGAPVRGRIRRLEQFADTKSYLAVGLEFTEIEAHGVTMQFYADLERISRAPGIEMSLNRTRFRAGKAVTERTFVPELPGVASFFVREKDLPALRNLRMTWRTRSLLR